MGTSTKPLIDTLTRTLQSHLDRAAADNPPALFTLRVHAPTRELDWLGAAGEHAHGDAH